MIVTMSPWKTMVFISDQVWNSLCQWVTVERGATIRNGPRIP